MRHFSIDLDKPPVYFAGRSQSASLLPNSNVGFVGCRRSLHIPANGNSAEVSPQGGFLMSVLN